MPLGYLLGTLLQGALVALTLTAPRRPRLLAGLAYRVASAYNEAPFVFIYLVVISSIDPLAGGRLDSPGGRVALVLGVLVYFHGGGYDGGRKSIEGRALLFRLASQGWVTISANYRLRPRVTFFDHLTDVKKVIAWVREHGHAYGADPSTLFLSGGSAGGHLSSIAALTQNDPRYQPGFEEADTSVTAVASLYGWYGGYDEMGGPASEVGVLGHDAGGA